MAKDTFLNRMWKLLSGFKLATAVLVLLLVITFLGTLEQVEYGLHAAVTKYFDSMWIWEVDVGACLRALSISAKDSKLSLGLLPVLPGGYLLLIIFSVNLLLGGLIRLRKKPHTIGIFISHASMLVMIVAGAVSFHFKKEGNLALFEGQTGDEFVSFHNRVVEVEQVDPKPADGKRKAWVIPMGHFADLTPDGSTGKSRSFKSSELPFELKLSNYIENCEPKRADGSETREVVDGYYLQPKAKETEAERNIDGIYATAKEGSTETRGMLWGAQAAPWTVKAGGKTFLVDLTRERYRLPFQVRLDKFDREVHPGTEKARKFTSHITVQKNGGSDQKRIITMNDPLRDAGFVLFQASFSMDEPGRPAKQSVFACAENPSDHWPLISCITAGIGLLIHFCVMLWRFSVRQRNQVAAA
jgi:hypothetical protein